MTENKQIYMWPSFWDKPHVRGKKGGVSTNNYYATKTGLEILKKGGNAFDAAIAISLVLAVVEAHHSGIGGGCFTLLYVQEDGKTYALDGRGTAPKQATKDLFLKNGEVQDERKDLGGESVAVPGLLRTLDEIQKKYASMDLKTLLEPAILYASQGFKTSFIGALAMSDDSVKRKMKYYKDFKKNFLKDNLEIYKYGDIQKNPALANILSKIQEEGIDYFYTGEMAQKIVDTVNKHEGRFEISDLEEFKPKYREIVESTYRDFTVQSFPPPGSGCTLIEMLNIIENKNLKDMGHNSAETIHTIAEAMKIGFADRSGKLADPDFVNIDSNILIDKKFAEKRFALINQLAQEYDNLDVEDDYHGNTSHFSVIDQYGNAISQTQTVRDWFGSGIVVDGFVLNNAMSDFSANPGEITSQGLKYGEENSIAGGKTPLSSMSPTLLLKNNGVYAALGSAGGPRIITGTLQGVINLVDFEMLPYSAVHFPYFNTLTLNQGLEIEYGISQDTLKILNEKNHKILTLGADESMSTMVNIVMQDERGSFASSTARTDGCGGILTENNEIMLEGFF